MFGPMFIEPGSETLESCMLCIVGFPDERITRLESRPLSRAVGYQAAQDTRTLAYG